MANVSFILDENYQYVAIYVNEKKYGDNHSLGYDPKYPSTWSDLIKSVRTFESINEHHLSKYGIENYLHQEQPFPEFFSDFKINELHNDSL